MKIDRIGVSNFYTELPNAIAAATPDGVDIAFGAYAELIMIIMIINIIMIVILLLLLPLLLLLLIIMIMILMLQGARPGLGHGPGAGRLPAGGHRPREARGGLQNNWGFTKEDLSVY